MKGIIVIICGDYIRLSVQAVKFVSCNNSSISEVHFVNSSQVHVLIEGCEGIHIENVLIEAPERSPNTDGIHISASHHVFVTNAIIATGKSFLKFFNFSFYFFGGKITC